MQPSQNWKRRGGAAILVALACALTACNSAQAPAGRQASGTERRGAPGDPVEKVNGRAITRIELERAVKVLLAQSQAPQPLPPQVVQKAKQSALDQLVSAELLYQAAGKVDAQAVDRQVAQKIAESRARYGSEEEFEKSLKELWMTPKDLQEFTRKDVVINDFIARRFAGKVQVSGADARGFYDRNRERFKVEDGVRASHILIAVDQKASAETRGKAREKALALLEQVKKGADFAALAKRESNCPSRVKGGDLGVFGKGQTEPAFEKAAFALKVGAVSGVVETSYGYHLIKVTERVPAHQESFQSAQARIVNYLKRDRTLKLVSAYLEELRSKARLEKV